MSLLSKARYEICELIGYVLCEFSFRWWDLFDKPVGDWRWWNHVIYHVGRPTYIVGCFFYGLNDNEPCDIILELSDGTSDPGECERCGAPCCACCGICDPCNEAEDEE